MEKNELTGIDKKLFPIYLKVAEMSRRPGDITSGDYSYGNELVLVLNEYRKNGKNFEPRFNVELEEHGIRVDHGDMSFIMRLTTARETFARATGKTFRDWLEAEGAPVDHLYENSSKERFKAITSEARQGTKAPHVDTGPSSSEYKKQPDLLDDAGAKEHKRPRKSNKKAQKLIAERTLKPVEDVNTKTPKVTKAPPVKAVSEMAANFFEFGDMGAAEMAKPKLSPEEKMAKYKEALGNNQTSSAPDLE